MNDPHLIFLALKRHLKARKVSYAELASRIGMSEANVKRIFSEESCSLARLGEICSAIQLSWADLIEASRDVEPEFFTLSAETEAFFAENLDYFVFFRQLEDGHGVERLQKENGLSAKDISRYLKKLEQLGLIERHSGDRIKLLPRGYLQLSHDSILKKRYFERWVPYFFGKVMRPARSHFFKIFSTGLSEKNRLALNRDLEDLCRKYQELGYLDQSKGSNPFESVGVCIGVGPYRVGEGPISDYRK